MSTQPLLHNSGGALTRDGSQIDWSVRTRDLVWVGIFSVLAIGPGVMGYSRSLAVAEPLILGLLIWSIARREARSTPLDLIAGAWLLSEIGSTIWSYHSGWGIHSSYPYDLYAGGYFGPIRLLADTSIAVMGAYTLNWSCRTSASSCNGLRRIAPILAASIGVVGLCIAEQLRNMMSGTDDPRIEATFTNPNLLGAFLCIALPISAGAAVSSGLSRTAKLGLSILTALLAASLILTQSRGAILGCMVATAYIGASSWVYQAANGVECARRAVAAVRALAISCAIIVVCALAIFPRVLHESRGVSDNQRRTAWIAAIIVIRSQPLTGLGIDGFPAAMESLRLREMNPDTVSGLPLVPAMHLHAHDLLLQGWVERGLFGAVTVCGLVALILRRAWTGLAKAGPRRDTITAGLIGALVATLVQNVTDYTFWYAPIAILFWSTLGLAFAPEPE